MRRCQQPPAQRMRSLRKVQVFAVSCWRCEPSWCCWWVPHQLSICPRRMPNFQRLNGKKRIRCLTVLKSFFETHSVSDSFVSLGGSLSQRKHTEKIHHSPTQQRRSGGRRCLREPSEASGKAFGKEKKRGKGRHCQTRSTRYNRSIVLIGIHIN